MTGSGRITVRLESELLERLRRYCEDTNCDVSHAVRQGLDHLWASESGSVAAEATPKRLSPPQNIFDLVPQYLSWGDGDVRKERTRLFCELLAVSFTCKKLYPRTKGMLEGYEGLLRLCQFFGVD